MGTEINSINHAIEQTTVLLNEQIKKIDWNQKWQTDYPRTERASKELESLANAEVKKKLKEVFSEQSLILSKIGENF